MEEIKKIEKRYDINGYHFKSDDHYYFDELEERFFFTIIYPEDTNLPVEIFVDESFGFERFEHPLWIYFQNTYNEDERKWTSILVDSPTIANENEEINLFENDYHKIISFVIKYRQELKLLANEKIKRKDFVNIIKENKLSNNLNKIHEEIKYHFNLNNVLNEMAILQPEETGLPMPIWLDEDKEYVKGGHGPRIKFQYAPHVKNSENYGVYTIPGKEVKYVPKKYYNPKQIKLLERFVDANQENIIKLANHEIELAAFIQSMKKLDKNGYPVEPVNELPYRTRKSNEYGFDMVINAEKKINYLSKYGTPLFNIWFEWGGPFIPDNKGGYYTTAGLGTVVYRIGSDGSMRQII